MPNKKEALNIAVREIERLQKSSGYDDFSPVGLYDETAAFWTFVSGSEAMFDEGIVPGAFFVSVDKADGHIWTRNEKEIFYERRAAHSAELQAA